MNVRLALIGGRLSPALNAPAPHRRRLPWFIGAGLLLAVGLAWIAWHQRAPAVVARPAVSHNAPTPHPATVTAAVPRPAAVAATQGWQRVVEGAHAGALFATHSWFVPPPPPAPPPPPPPALPTAPPFPYTLMGAYTAQGGKTVYFLSRDDRVIDAHVGDRLDGVYDFESASGGQLVFNYLPLNMRTSLPSGNSP